MKLYTKIVSILLVAGLATAGAQSATQSDKNFYVKGSVGYADLDSEGGLNELFKSFTGLNPELDSATSFSFEGGLYFGKNFSLGFEWTMFDSEAGAQYALVDGNGEIAIVKEILNISPALELAGDFRIEEEIDTDRFMFTFNYEHFLNDQFSLLINSGLGFLNVEQVIKASSQPTTGNVVNAVNSKADETVFAYQIGLSMCYRFDDAFSFYGGARYLGSSDADFNHIAEPDRKFTVKDFSADAFVYELGMAYNF